MNCRRTRSTLLRWGPPLLGRLILIPVCLLACTRWCHAGASTTSTNALDQTQAIVAFDAANKLYEQGKFVAAGQAYQRLIDSGVRSTTLFFNAGNAWFKARQLGRAIAAYRQAQNLTPRDPGVQFNLNFVRKSITKSDSHSAPILERMLSAMTANEWTILAAAVVWLTLLILSLGELRETFRPAARRYGILGGGAALLIFACALAATLRSAQLSEGVVIVPTAVVRTGPLEDASVRHQFGDGTEVKILDRKRLAGERGQTWFLVKNAGAQSGWVKEDQLALIQ